MYNVAIALAIIVIAIWPLWVIEYPIYKKIIKKEPFCIPVFFGVSGVLAIILHIVNLII